MSYPLPLNETNRIETLYSYNILDTLPELTFDSIAKIASVICKTPISVISFSDKKREWFKSTVGLEFKEIPRDISFCSYTILENDIFIVEDTLSDPRFSNNPLVLNDPLIRFYAGVPIKSKDGYNLGALCVIDRIPRQLSQEQIELLISLSDQVIALIELKKYVVNIEDKKARLDILLENTDADIWSIDTNYNLISFNSAFKKNFEIGFKISPYIGLNLKPYTDISHDLDWRKFYEKALQGEKFTTDYHTKNNEMYNEVSFNPIIFNNQVTGVTVFSRDITEKKLKDLQIRESENKFKVAFDYSPIGMSLFSDQRKWVRLNKAFCEMIGYTEEELLKLTFEDITHPEDIETDKLYLRQIINHEITSYQREKRYIHKNGSIIWGKVHASLVTDNTGKVLYFIVQIQNITDKKADELKLLESENKFRSAFDYSAISTALISLDTKFLSVNKAFCDMIGYSEQELLAMSFIELTYPDDSLNTIHLYNKLLKNEINSYETEKRYIHKDGHLICLFISVSAVYDNNGKIIYLLNQVLDMTQRKEDEKKLIFNSSILQNVQDCIMVTDMGGYITYWNQGATSIFGYSEEEVIGKKVDIAYPDNALTLLEDSLERIASGGHYNSEWRARAKNGSDVWLDLKTTPLLDNNGHISGFIGVSKDITEKKKAQEELIKAKEVAEKALRIKSDFLATISHELRTPMNGVIGMTELLLNTRLEPEQSEYVQIINKSGNALLTVINDILDISKIESGNIILEKKPFELRKCIEDVFDLMSIKAKEKNIELIYYVGSDLPKFIIGDVTKLRQILINMLDNGLKFTEKGELYISAELIKKEDNVLIVKFIVRDTGIGMDTDTINNLFQVFSQADSSLTRKHGGTGLGLAISQRLIHLMNGNICIESEPGKGSEFTFTISFQSSLGSQEENFQDLKYKLSNKEILIIDDSTTNIQVLNNYITKWNMTSSSTHSPFIVMNKLKEQLFDALIIDIDMRPINGLKLAEEIRKIYSSDILPIILLSSSEEEIKKYKEKSNFSFTYLSKPIKEIELFNSLVKILSKKVVSSINTNIIDSSFAFNYPLKILLAEDNPINQKLATKMLGKMGYNVDVANDGLEAVKAVKCQDYDLIFMDVQMPVMDGLEATKCITESCDKKPVIVALTANAMDGDREICLNAGMDDYLSKPVSIQYLKDTLIKWSNTKNQ